MLPQVNAQRARIETRLADDLPRISIDRHRTLQVLLNLLGNALKFGAAGGLMTLGAERQDDNIRIWVQDTGNGIPREQLPRVFDRFWRVPNNERRVPGSAFRSSRVSWKPTAAGSGCKARPVRAARSSSLFQPPPATPCRPPDIAVAHLPSRASELHCPAL